MAGVKLYKDGGVYLNIYLSKNIYKTLNVKKNESVSKKINKVLSQALGCEM